MKFPGSVCLPILVCVTPVPVLLEINFLFSCSKQSKAKQNHNQNQPTNQPPQNKTQNKTLNKTHQHHILGGLEITEIVPHVSGVWDFLVGVTELSYPAGLLFNPQMLPPC